MAVAWLSRWGPCTERRGSRCTNPTSRTTPWCSRSSSCAHLDSGDQLLPFPLSVSGSLAVVSRSLSSSLPRSIRGVSVSRAPLRRHRLASAPSPYSWRGPTALPVVLCSCEPSGHPPAFSALASAYLSPGSFSLGPGGLRRSRAQPFPRVLSPLPRRKRHRCRSAIPTALLPSPVIEWLGFQSVQAYVAPGCSRGLLSV